MSPDQALLNLDQATAQLSVPRAQHQLIVQSIQVLKSLVDKEAKALESSKKKSPPLKEVTKEDKKIG